MLALLIVPFATPARRPVTIGALPEQVERAVPIAPAIVPMTFAASADP